jgi:glycosyltransferase involved in cell wall biosynthesis
MVDLAIIILCHNEEIHLARALKHVAGIATQIFVIDSFSTDATVEIATEHGATVLQHEFINYSKQFQWALENAPITAAWIMRLDADEIVEADLAKEIVAKLQGMPANVIGINLKRKHIFLGRWIRHGGRYPLILLRIWRRGHGQIEDRWMDEHIVVSGGRTVEFQGGFADHNLKDITFFIDKHNKYATREAIDTLNHQLDLFPTREKVTASTVSWQASVKRVMKYKVYSRIPFQYSALLYFLYRYFIQLGFVDGIEGLSYHVLQGFWYRFLVGAKVLELKRAISHLHDKDEIKSELSKLSGLKLR